MNQEVTGYPHQVRKKLIVYLLPLIFGLLTLLTGCVNYDVGVTFDSPYEGSIVQHLHIGEDLTNLDRAATRKWLNSIEDRTYQLQGKVKRVSSEELAVVIPFHNGQELVNKFNQFFYGESSPPGSSSATEQASINSQMSLGQSNLLLLERNYLDLTIDLRALGTIDNESKIVVTPNSFVNLTFQLKSGWIARSLKGGDRLAPVKSIPGKLIWQLQPGKINHIAAVVWLPSPLGIGTAAVILLVLAGYYLKYRRLPGINTATTPLG